jgi:hypothetical protein
MSRKGTDEGKKGKREERVAEKKEGEGGREVAENKGEGVAITYLLTMVVITSIIHGVDSEVDDDYDSEE